MSTLIVEQDIVERETRDVGLTSPVGQYEAELLVLAPEAGEEANTKSLVSQLLGLGVAIELDENWRLPTVPPKELSRYKACLFPESARQKYDAELNAYYRDGGFLGYFKYFPVDTPTIQGVHNFLITYGRDVHFWTIANKMLEGDLTVQHPDFVRTLQRRSVDSMIAEYRARYFERYGQRNRAVWSNWGDIGYSEFLVNIRLADRLQDSEWASLVEYCLTLAARSVPEALSGKFSETRELPDTTYLGLVLNATVLLERGDALNRDDWKQAGAELMGSFVDQAYVKDGILSTKYMRQFWSESIIPAPGLYWLARVTGDAKFAGYADDIAYQVATRNQREHGLWNHWTDSRGNRGAAWSCASMWSLLFLIESLPAIDADSASAEFIRQSISKTLRALAKAQHPEQGLWHLVMDEPDTRLETRASSGIVYCYDRLNDLGLLTDQDREVAERAFIGLKSLYYQGGMGNSCRGTATGVDDYYRTRPMGYFDMGLMPGALADRSETNRH